MLVNLEVEDDEDEVEEEDEELSVSEDEESASEEEDEWARFLTLCSMWIRQDSLPELFGTNLCPVQCYTYNYLQASFHALFILRGVY